MYHCWFVDYYYPNLFLPLPQTANSDKYSLDLNTWHELKSTLARSSPVFKSAAAPPLSLSSLLYNPTSRVTLPAGIPLQHTFLTGFPPTLERCLKPAAPSREGHYLEPASDSCKGPGRLPLAYNAHPTLSTPLFPPYDPMVRPAARANPPCGGLRYNTLLVPLGPRTCNPALIQPRDRQPHLRYLGILLPQLVPFT